MHINIDDTINGRRFFIDLNKIVLMEQICSSTKTIYYVMFAIGNSTFEISVDKDQHEKIYQMIQMTQKYI